MTVHDLAADGSWEDKHSGFMLAGSRIVWESAVYTRRGKLVVSRVVDNGKGKPWIMGLGYIQRYVSPKEIVHRLIPRKTK